MPQVSAGELLFYAAPLGHRAVTAKLSLYGAFTCQETLFTVKDVYFCHIWNSTDFYEITQNLSTDFSVASKAETRHTDNAHKTTFPFKALKAQQVFHHYTEKGMGRNFGTNVVLSSPTSLLHCIGHTLITIPWHLLPTYRFHKWQLCH